MSLDSIDLDHAEAVALLQPFVDGELADDEHELVAREIADNPAYQAFVREQQEVRAVLHELAREAAPPGLRERILADLDKVEAERETSWVAPVVGRIRAFGRGALLMVPAAAAAAILLVVAGNAGWLEPALDGTHVDGGMATSLRLPARAAQPAGRAVGPAAGQPEAARANPEIDAAPAGVGVGLPSGEDLAEGGFAVQVAPARTLPSGVALVSDSERAPGSFAMVRYRDGGGAVMVDRQRRALGVELEGARQVFRGRDYYLARDDQGRARVEFELGAVHHSLVLEGGAAGIDAEVGVEAPDFHGLLVVADALRRAHEG